MAKESVNDCLNDLTDAEKERAVGYVMPRIRDQFVVGRSVLRRLLAGYLSTNVNEVEMITSDDGKPILADPRIELHFNVAHSNGWAMVALAKRPVGIDLEVVRDVPNAEGLVKRFFSPIERDQFESLPIELKRDGFLRGWTCKEAVLKGTGAGMRDVSSCVVCLDPTEPPRVIQYSGRPAREMWGLGMWSPAAGMIAAVAVEGCERMEIS